MNLLASSSRQRSGKDKEQVGQSTTAAGWTKASDVKKKITKVGSDWNKIIRKDPKKTFDEEMELWIGHLHASLLALW